jgi:quinol monooxygenase YgiN
MVSYIDVALPAAATTADLLRQMAQSARRAHGLVRYDVLRRLAPQNEFAIVEVWKDQQSRAAHVEDASIARLRAGLDPLLVAPLDARLYNVVAMTERSSTPSDALFAISHIDILGPNPAGRDAFLPVLKAFRENSRRAPGNLVYDLVEQASRTNHFETIEVWTDYGSATEHEISAINRTFRATLSPVSSSPYDRRLFKALQ